MATPDTPLRIGRVVSVQVPRREVRIAPETDVTERFETMAVARFIDVRGGRHEWPVTAWRSGGRNVVLVLDGPTDAQVAELRKATVVIPAEERGQLPEDRFFYDDAIGAEVVDATGRVLGTVASIMENPEYSLLEVCGTDGREYTIACVETHVLAMPDADGRIVVDPTYLLNEDGRAY